MLAIAREAAEEPELLKDAPHHRPVHRLDEVRAAKRPVVKYGFEEHPAAAGEPRVAAAAEAPKGA
jgi:glycine cleavage system protein P-like pyridoxal-binding family